MGTTPVAENAIATHNLNLGRFIFYPNLIVGEFAEGVHVTFDNAALLIQMATQVYGSEEPIVYIWHRINSYSANLVAYKEVLELFPNFKAMAVVSQNRRRRMLANLERLFIKSPLRVFDTMDDAVKWAQAILQQSRC